MKSLVLVGILLISLQLVCGRVFTKCELAKELLSQDFPRGSIPDWVCLAEAESTLNTAAVGGPNWDGSYDHGLFQINDRYWCGVGTAGGVCKVPCSSLETDDITIASLCSKVIYGIHGFSAWVGWTNKCQGNLPDLSSCGI